MKRSVFIMALALCACSTAQGVQQQCAQITHSFPAEVQCMNNVAAQDNFLKNDSFTQEYILKAKVLSEKFQQGKISENEARYELAQSYNKMMVEQEKLNAYSAWKWNSLSPRESLCERRGDQFYCRQY